MRIIRLFFIRLVVVVCLGGFPTITSFVVSPSLLSSSSSSFRQRNARRESNRGLSSIDRFRRFTRYGSSKQGHQREEEETYDDPKRRKTGSNNEDEDENADKGDGVNTNGFHQPELLTYDDEDGEEIGTAATTSSTPTPNSNINSNSNINDNPDRAISIVSELKANAALFAAFAYGSLNLPSTLTVSESKVTSVTTSISISRPLPDSDLVRIFVVLDVCTLCLMISCVAASQLLIYRLTDGSYEEEYRKKKNMNPRDSALGRLVTTYRDEFTVARITFDFGLVTLLLAVGVRTLATFDEDISVPVTSVIATTAVFLATAYITSYIEVFQRAEKFSKDDDEANQKRSTLSSLTETNTNNDNGKNRKILPRIILPLTISIGLGVYFSLMDGSSGLDLPRLGPYGFTTGESKIRVVTEKIDSEKTKQLKLDAKERKERKSFLKKSSSSFNADTNNSLEKTTASEKVASDGFTTGESKIRVVTEKIDSEKTKQLKLDTKERTERKSFLKKSFSSFNADINNSLEKATASEKVASD
ncbi:MAG: hypothetical protein ACI90V_006264 [Bacillariaceae sp.]|jgi:hypothetical protein